MGQKRSGRRPAQTSAAIPESAADGSGSRGARWRSFFLGELLGATLGRFTNIVIAPILGFAGLMLVIAWQSGPQRIIDNARYAKLTARVDGRIVESWLAVEFDPSDMGQRLLWRPHAYASPCAVVTYEGARGAPQRRAFCGTRLKFSDSYTLPDLSELAPNVPFAWMRDTNGFALPEIRITPAGRQWLATHRPESTFGLPRPPATALEELRLLIDRPVDLAIIGWGVPAPKFPLALNPWKPAGAIPAGFLKDRWGPNWLVFPMAAIVGLAVWYEAMALLFGDLPRAFGYVLLVLPLLALPWWGEQFPRFLSRFHKGFASVVAEMFQDIDPLGRLVASDPEDATLAGGDRLVWRLSDSVYADTLGRFHFARPDPAPASADAAVVALADTVTAQTRLLPEGDRVALFRRLREEKENWWLGAGFLFLPAARERMIDPQSSPTERLTAKNFLTAWFTQPEETVGPKDLGSTARLDIYRTLSDVSDPYIALGAKSFAGPARKP